MEKQIIIDIFDAFHCVVLDENRHDNLTDKDVINAMTLNKELNAIGYTLRPEDILKLAHQNDFSNIRQVIEAHEERTQGYKPMYPDFPKTVLDIDEATFRFHQLVHYFSTYGIEDIFGVEVKNGWMPTANETEKTLKDKQLTKLKVLRLETENETIDRVNNVLGKKERFTTSERRLVQHYANKLDLYPNCIPFKENIVTLLPQEDLKSKLNMKTDEFLIKVCQHPGDVLDTLDNYTYQEKYYSRKKLPTSLKKSFVRALESFEKEALEENLANNRERNIYLLNAISTGVYAKKDKPLLETVEKLKDKELLSWNGKVEEKIREDKNNNTYEALNFISKHPGEMLRMAGRLYRLGYDGEEIKDCLSSSNFKTQTLISNATFFGQEYENSNNKKDFNYGYLNTNKIIKKTGNINRNEEEHNFLYDLNRTLLKQNLSQINSCLEGKKIYIETQEYDFKNTLINTNEKSEGSGYLTSGLAFKIPEDANYLRFFTFWNDDKKRVDLDMHIQGEDNSGAPVHIGWSGNYKKEGIVFSGDITSSQNSAEYIDINLNETNAKSVHCEVDYYNANYNDENNSYTLSDVEKAFSGAMLVNSINENIKLYEPKNCLFSYDLTNISKDGVSLVDIYPHDGFIRIASQSKNSKGLDANMIDSSKYNLEEYLKDFAEVHDIEYVLSPEQADIVLSISPLENCSVYNYCLLDNNFGIDEMEKTKEELNMFLNKESGEVER